MKVAEVTKAWVGQADLSTLEQYQLALWLTGLDESLAWYEGIVLDCFDLRRREDSFSLRIQGRRFAHGKAGEAVVAWADGATFYDALFKFSRDVARGEVRWRGDKYPVFDK